MRSVRPRSNGFTLIELLVVIAIIAVLISVLMPALGAAKAQGTLTQCLANLREITKAGLLYAQDDPKEIYGPIHPRAEEFMWEGYAEYGGGPGISPFVGWDEPFDPRTRPFNAIMYGNMNNIGKGTAPGDRGVFKVFQCPGEEYGWQEWPHVSANETELEKSYFKANGTAYRMNNSTHGYSGYRECVGVYARPSTQIPSTGTTISFFEARALQTGETNDVWWARKDLTGELTGYHKKLGYFTLAFVDGHAAFADMGNGTYYPRSERYNEWDHRGTWGQFDTFPSQPIPEP
jgi:prepilin-type N-terminal cleavage/methylation domain-containing protein